MWNDWCLGCVGCISWLLLFIYMIGWCVWIFGVGYVNGVVCDCVLLLIVYIDCIKCEKICIEYWKIMNYVFCVCCWYCCWLIVWLWWLFDCCVMLMLYIVIYSDVYGCMVRMWMYICILLWMLMGDWVCDYMLGIFCGVWWLRICVSFLRSVVVWCVWIFWWGVRGEVGGMDLWSLILRLRCRLWWCGWMVCEERCGLGVDWTRSRGEDRDRGRDEDCEWWVWVCEMGENEGMWWRLMMECVVLVNCRYVVWWLYDYGARR